RMIPKGIGEKPKLVGDARNAVPCFHCVLGRHNEELPGNLTTVRLKRERTNELASPAPFTAPLRACKKISNCFYAAFKRSRVPGTFYRSLTVTAPYVVDAANGAATVRKR